MITKNEIALIKSLDKKRERENHRLFVVEGWKMVQEVVNSSFVVERLYATEQPEWLPKAELVSPKEMERISNMKASQGVVALVRMPEREEIQNIGEALTIVLDGIQDPGNVGTIIRVADWFGVEQIVCSPQSADCYNPKVVQATMGAVFRVKIAYQELEPILERAKNRGLEIYGALLDGENIYSATISQPTKGIIVVGSEGGGIRGEIERLVTKRVSIPPYPKDRKTTESLNAAMATAIICAEFRRRAIQ